MTKEDAWNFLRSSRTFTIPGSPRDTNQRSERSISTNQNIMTTVKNLLSAALIVASGSIYAQNQSWVANDYMGVSHDIANDISMGYTVLVDLSAHWCGPCWGWHNTGIMDKMYLEYGPNGTGDVKVYFIDATGNPPSTVALLQGGAGSQGDWTAGTAYPIIGPNGQGQLVGGAYNFSAFPTLFMHHPGASQGSVISRESSFQAFFDSWATSAAGAFDHGPNDATLYGNHDPVEVCPGYTPSIELVNAGTSPLTSAVASRPLRFLSASYQS